MLTGSPSKKVSPLSVACVPATHLTRVDLPAPLSPTSAITSPCRTSKSTSVSAWTEPKALLMLRSSRSGGVSVMWGSGGSRERIRWRRREDASTRVERVRLAVLLVLADADLGLLQEALREELGVVLLGDPHDGKCLRRFLHLAVQPERVRRRLLAVQQCDGGRGRGSGLARDVLVDGAGLPAGEDVL